MTSSEDPSSRTAAALHRAWATVEAASARSGIEISVCEDNRSLDDARRIFDEVWPSVDGGTQVRPNLLRALTHAGGYCVTARDLRSGSLLGATLAFMGRAVDGTPYLHSHMSAVVVSARDRHIGTAMKQHQRWWALRESVPVITWTFDPLVRRNAYLNLCKLGIQVRDYHVDFYGDMADAINSGDPTDRLVAWWVVDSARAQLAADGLLRPETEEQARQSGAELVPTPQDIVAVRGVDPASAAQWRLTVRESLLDAFGRGLIIDGITDTGSYILRREPTP